MLVLYPKKKMLVFERQLQDNFSRFSFPRNRGFKTKELCLQGRKIDTELASKSVLTVTKMTKMCILQTKVIKNLPTEYANKMQADDPDYAIRDLYDAIERGEYPEWKFCIQV